MAPRVFHAQPLPPTERGLVAAPFQFRFDGKTNLRIEGWNALTGVSLLVQGQFLTDDGKVEHFSQVVAVAATRLRVAFDMPMGIGFLLTLVVVATGAAPLIGQTFASVSVIQGITGQTYLMGTLVAGYVTARQAIAWPGSPIVNSLEGPGVARTVVGTDPAAGEECSELVPTGARWFIDAIELELETSATAANRLVTIRYDDPNLNGRGLYRMWSPLAQTASQDRNHYFAVGVALTTVFASATEDPCAALPQGMALLAGQRVRSATENLQAGDNYNAPVLQLRELLECAA